MKARQIGMGVLGLLLTVYVTRFDVAWSVAARQFPLATAQEVRPDTADYLGSFLAFMDQSLFEGAGFGAGDVPLLLQIAAFLLYLASFWSDAPTRLKNSRAAWAYMWVTALLTAAVVHLFKGLVARPRPPVTLQDGAGFFPWFAVDMPRLFEFGRGSFPSGHTASAMTLWSTVLVLDRLCPARRMIKISWSGLCLLFAGAMAFSRVSHGDHWPTDTLASLVLTWVICQLLAPTLLSPAREAVTTRTAAQDFKHDLLLLAWWLGATIVLGLFYLGVKFTLAGAPLIGTLAFVASFGGGYGVGVARAQRPWT